MRIAATTIGMDAALTSKETEQRINHLSTSSATGQTDAFGIRLASLLASSTHSLCSCRSVISPVRGGVAPLDAGAPAQTDTSKTVLAQLAEQVIGQQVTITALEQELTALPPGQTASPLFSLGTAQLMRGTLSSERQSLLFAAQGCVETTDGRRISFDLGLSMERTTVAAQTALLGVTPLFIDPLILQFDLDAPLLGDTVFRFDLDSDGIKEELACPGSGCGFLAFDRNGDGVINNGLELFGPSSGSGFGELAELDDDANLWIDESDPLFAQLRIWTQDGQGGRSLRTLKEAGVGAIAVTHAGSGFELQQTDGTVLGTIKASSLFLTEDGQVRPMHEVDLASPAIPENAGSAVPSPTESRFDTALRALRDIIGIQRMRLQMMLTGQRLRGTMVRKEERHDLLFNWLQARGEWQTQLERRFELRPGPADRPVLAASGGDTAAVRHG